MDSKMQEQATNTMLEIRRDIHERLSHEKREIEGIEFYSTFKMTGDRMNLEKSNIYKVKIKDDSIPEKEMDPREKEEQQFTYELYDENKNLIATIDEKGVITFEASFLEQLGEENMELLGIDENGSMKYEELGKEEMSLTKEELEEKAAEKEAEKENSEKLEEISKKIGSKDIESYSEINTDQTPMFDKLTSKQEIDPNARVTQSETLADMIPEIKEKGIVKVGVVYSDHSQGQSGRFSFVGIDKDGKIHTIDSLENTQGTTTGQTVTSINSRDGSVVEEEQVAGMVRINGRSKTNGQEEMLSVRVGQYGILEVDYVRADLSRDKDERYLSAPIETKNMKPTTREVKEAMDKHKNSEIDTELERADENIEGKEETDLRSIDDTASNDQITEDSVLILENGEEVTVQELSKRLSISTKSVVDMYNNEVGGQTVDEKIENMETEVNEQFSGRSQMEHEHRR